MNKIISNKKIISKNISKNKNNIVITNEKFNLDLSNSSVCIVSYAAYMKNKKLGTYIDSFDYVTRINIGICSFNLNKNLPILFFKL